MNKIGIVGLGYVGLPHAVEFSKKNKVTGFDISGKRINELSEVFLNSYSHKANKK